MVLSSDGQNSIDSLKPIRESIVFHESVFHFESVF